MGLDYKKKYLKYKNKYLEAKKIYGGADKTYPVDNPAAAIATANEWVGLLNSIDQIFIDLKDFKFTDTVDDDNFKTMLTKLHEQQPQDDRVGNIDNLIILLKKAQTLELQKKIKTKIKENSNKKAKKFFEIIFTHPVKYHKLTQSKQAELANASLPDEDSNDLVPDPDGASNIQDVQRNDDLGAVDDEEDEEPNNPSPLPPVEEDGKPTPVVGNEVFTENVDLGLERENASKKGTRLREEVRERVDLKKLVGLMQDITQTEFADTFKKIKDKLERTEASSNLRDLFTDCDMLKNLLFKLLKKTDVGVNETKVAKEALENLDGIVKTLKAEEEGGPMSGPQYFFEEPPPVDGEEE